MRVFLSWSGDTSRALAETLRDWLPTALHFVDPWMSSDITKGARQDAEMAKILEGTSYCIVCVTPGVQHAPWVNFEAGAISAVVDRSYVSPVLLGVSMNDLRSLPLERFQCTEIDDKEELTRLLQSINDASESAITATALERNVTNLWPTLQARVSGIDVSGTDAAASSDTSLTDNTAETPAGQVLDIEKTILVLLADEQQRSAERIADDIGQQLTRTKHHISTLVRNEMLHDLLFVHRPPMYQLAEKGRAYLVQHDLIP